MLGVNVGRLFNPSIIPSGPISHVYRKAITVTNSTGGTLTNYQVHIQTDTATPITAGKMNALGNNLRVYDSDATTLLHSWFDPDTINSATTDIWVKIPSLPNGTYTIYLYYGGTTTFTNDIVNTFIYGDDFSSNTASNYTTGGGAVTVDTTNKWMKLAANVGQATFSDPTTQTNPASYIVEAKVKITTVANDNFAGLSGFKATLGAQSGYVCQMGNLSNVKTLDIENAGVSHDTNTGLSFTDGTFYPLKGIFVNGTIKASFNNDATVITDTSNAHTSGGYGMRGYDTDTFYKYFRVRAYTATEPTTSVGSETLVS